jgi:hypothetical protein
MAEIHAFSPNCDNPQAVARNDAAETAGGDNSQDAMPASPDIPTHPGGGRRTEEQENDQELSSLTPRSVPQACDVLLEISPFESDGGERVGKTPTDVPSEILSLYYREKNPLKAIRARCLDCCCGSPSEVRKCVSIDCRSWPFRMGKNPLRVKRLLSDKQKREMAGRLGRRR